MFTVQIRLDGENLATQIAEVSEWFKAQRMAPGAFQYQMRPEHVRLRIDFTTFARGGSVRRRPWRLGARGKEARSGRRLSQLQGYA